MSTGRLFHAHGADTLNARSPNFSLVQWYEQLFIAGRSQDCTETGCSNFDMQSGAFPIVARCTRRQSLYCTQASIGSQCNSINAGVTGSRDRRLQTLQTSRAAALTTHCNGTMDGYGRATRSVLQQLRRDKMNAATRLAVTSRPSRQRICRRRRIWQKHACVVFAMYTKSPSCCAYRPTSAHFMVINYNKTHLYFVTVIDKCSS